MLGRIRQVEICGKKSIIDGADKVESLLITDAMSSNVLSFSKESSRLKRLLIDGAGWVFQFFSFSLSHHTSKSGTNYHI